MANRIVLLDNGSLRADATLSLRRLADGLGERLGETVHPVSLLHSSKIPAEELGGVAAWTWRRFLRKQLESGAAEFAIVPLFFGPSSAIVDYLPKVTREVLGDAGGRVRVAAPLVNWEDEDDDDMAAILHDLLIRKMDTPGDASPPAVVLVDHGSPIREVARCRDLVAKQLGKRLGPRAKRVVAASMERREGDEYAFNEPLLERALSELAEAGESRLALSYLFFSPGRHAGPGGDIDAILANSPWATEGRSLVKAPLVGESPLLLNLLERRYRELEGGT